MLFNVWSKIFLLEGFVQLRNLFFILLVDGLLLDDEPLWEPLEWSVYQTWILYMYLFAWAAEVIFSSRYGSYTNRDKIVWIGLFKVYYFLLLWFTLNIIIVTIFVTMPFYFEITYSISYSVVWWNWFNSVFFFKFTFWFMIVFSLIQFLKFNLRWLEINQISLLLLPIVVILFNLFFFNAYILFFGYFSDPSEFRSSGWSNYSRIVNGPQKWGWGLDSRDHFAYHRTPTVFWFKNDPLLASSMLFLNIFLFFFLFFTILQVLAIIRVIVSSKDISYNLLLFLSSTVKHFCFLINFLQLLVLLSYIYQFIRYPFELYWFSKLFYFFELEVLVLVDLLNFFLM